MKMRSLFGSVLFFIFALALVVGCGSAKGAASKVSGKVSYSGQPVTGGTVVFHSETGVYSTTINPDGTYALSDLPEGEMVVTVETESLNPDIKKPVYVGGTSGGAADKMRPAGYGKQGGSAGKGAPSKQAITAGAGKQKDSPIPEGANVDVGTYVKIPKNYADKTKSPLKAAVKRGSQELNLELKD